jgi:hypothetical protein
MNFVSGVIQKVLDGREQQRTKTTAAGVCILKPITFQYHHKKILREVLGVLGRITTSGDESKNRPPVYAAKLGECRTGFLLFAFGAGTGKNKAPACRDECAPPDGSFVRAG